MTHLHIKLLIFQSLPGASQVVLVVKNPSADAGVIRDVGSIPGQEDLLEEGTATHCSILAWRIPWTEEPGGLVHRVIQSRTRLKQLSTHACTVFPGGSGSKEYACNAEDLGSVLEGKIPWRRAWQPSPVFLPGESRGQKSLAGYPPWGRKE